jgi:flagellar hook-associated protein 2
MATSTDASFRAGGLASGIDTSSIIEQLMALERRPIDQLKTRQTGLRTQISTIGDISAKLNSLSTAAKALGTGGTLATKIESTNTSFAATSGSGATAGQHTIKVTELAAAAQLRSGGFADVATAMKGGNMRMEVMGTEVLVPRADGATLADVAMAIRNANSAVSATVVNDGTLSYLSLINRETGFPLTSDATHALNISHEPSGTANPANATLSFVPVQPASNAKLTVNGLPITRMGNSIADVIPGVTLSLKALTLTPNETLVIGNDAGATATNLGKFVTAYNETLKIIQGQLQATELTDRSKTLAGDTTLQGLQRNLQRLAIGVVGTGTVRTLADLGIKTARDGSLSLDQPTLEKAMTRDAAAANEIFANATSGLGAMTEGMAKRYTSSLDGLLSTRKNGINDSIKRMDGEIEKMERRVDSRRLHLIAQFTSMEKIVSSLKSTGNFMTQQFASMSMNGSGS